MARAQAFVLYQCEQSLNLRVETGGQHLALSTGAVKCFLVRMMAITMDRQDQQPVHVG